MYSCAARKPSITTSMLVSLISGISIFPEKPKKNSAGIIVLVVVIIGGIAVGYFYLKGQKSKKTVSEHIDPDADYIEDEENYLDQILEEDSSEEEMENDKI